MTRSETTAEVADVASCRHPALVAGFGERETPITGERRGLLGRRELELKVALDQSAELFAVLVAHVDKFDAAAVRSDIADYRGEVDLA